MWRQHLKTDNIQFVSLFWGSKYSEQYIEKLYHSIRRHCSYKIPFVLLTDKKGLIVDSAPEIETQLCPTDWFGWWQKIHLFNAAVMRRRFSIFIDLDVILLKNIDYLLSYVGKYELVYAQDLIDALSSSFLITDTESRLSKDVIKNFDPAYWVKEEDIDQDYLRLFIKKADYNIQGLAPQDHYSYKYLVDLDNWREKTSNTLYEERTFSELTMLNFHGKPKPEDLQTHPQIWPKAPELLKFWRI